MSNNDILVNGAPFDSEAYRQQLVTLAQYVASTNFLRLVVWRAGIHDILAVQGPANGPIESVMCVVVGVISREKAFLGTNGTFNPRFAEPLKNATAAKWQFHLEDPVAHPAFSRDWPGVLDNVDNVQGQVARTNDKRHWKLAGGKLKMGRAMWVLKSPENTDAASNAVTNNYPINRECAEWWETVKATHQISLMPVYGLNDTLNTRPETWEAALVGALVEVTFTVKHFYMGITSTRPQAYDVFSATIESISILGAPPPVRPSPFRQAVSPTKPRHMPQIPAAAALIPRSANLPAVTRPEFVEGGSGDVKSGGALGNLEEVRNKSVTSDGTEGGSEEGRATSNEAPDAPPPGSQQEGGQEPLATEHTSKTTTPVGGEGAGAEQETPSEGNQETDTGAATLDERQRGTRAAIARGKKRAVDTQDEGNGSSDGKRAKKGGD